MRKVSAARVLGGKLRRHMVTHYLYRERGLLVLRGVSRDFIIRRPNLHLLKLVTGVDISTRPVSSSGNPEKAVKRRSRKAAAPPKRAAFLLLISIVVVCT